MKISKVETGSILEFSHFDRSHEVHVMQISGSDEMKVVETLAKFAGCSDPILAYLRTCFAFTIIARSSGAVQVPVDKAFAGPAFNGHILMTT